jgi:hypothetical protein
MQPIIAARQSEIADLCRRFHVRRLDVFGSAAAGGFDPARSDIDILVAFAPGSPLRALDAFFGLKEGLETLLGRPVDLLMQDAVENPYLRASIERQRKLLYAAA